MQNTLFKNDDLRVRLCYYQSEEQMRPHSHDVHQISFFMCGGMYEKSRSRELEVFSPSIGIKPAGFIHANQYNQLGSFILSLNINPECDNQLPIDISDWHWQPQASMQLTNKIKQTLALMVDKPTTESNLAWDLLALSQTAPQKTSKSAPLWLNRLRAQLQEDHSACLTELAKQSEVHPAYLSRVFNQFFGLTPSLFRAYSQLSKALESINSGNNLADTALNAGFSDQAHFTRQAKRLFGLSPKKLQNIILQSH